MNSGRAASLEEAPVGRGWIASPAFDLAAFVGAPVAGLAFLALAIGVPTHLSGLVQSAVFYFIAVPHYMSTYTFFMDDANRQYYARRRAAFYLGPIGIAVVVTGLWILRFPPIIQAAVFSWNVWHVARQNNGILSMYRRLHAGDRAEFAPGNWALLGVSAAMALWQIDRYPPIGDALHAVHPLAARACAVGAAAVGLVALIVLVRRLRAPGRVVAWQEWAFLGASLVMFHPYLWVEDYTVATLGMLMGHFVQYLALVWLAHHRTYAGGAGGTAPQRWLARLSQTATTVGVFIVASGLFFITANRATGALGVPSVYTVSWFAFTFIHFYLDGFLWAFRDPFIRDSLGRVLMPAERVVA